jgi:hypothetical protein
MSPLSPADRPPLPPTTVPATGALATAAQPPPTPAPGHTPAATITPEHQLTGGALANDEVSR